MNASSKRPTSSALGSALLPARRYELRPVPGCKGLSVIGKQPPWMKSLATVRHEGAVVYRDALLDTWVVVTLHGDKRIVTTGVNVQQAVARRVKRIRGPWIRLQRVKRRPAHASRAT